jgi:hypothetical protein
MNAIKRQLVYLMLFLIGAALVIAILPTGFKNNFWLSRSIEYQVSGSLELASVQSTSVPNVVNGSWSGDCRTDQGTFTRKQCFAAPITTFDIGFKSANCGSTATANIDATDLNCINVTEIRRGCGEDNILGIRNCRGRGWVSYVLTAYTTAIQSQPIRNVPVKGDLTSSRPLIVRFQPIASNETNPPKIAYKLEVRNADRVVATLTETQPSWSNDAGETFGVNLNLSDGELEVANRRK